MYLIFFFFLSFFPVCRMHEMSLKRLSCRLEIYPKGICRRMTTTQDLSEKVSHLSSCSTSLFLIHFTRSGETGLVGTLHCHLILCVLNVEKRGSTDFSGLPQMPFHVYLSCTATSWGTCLISVLGCQQSNGVEGSSHIGIWIDVISRRDFSIFSSLEGCNSPS